MRISELHSAVYMKQNVQMAGRASTLGDTETARNSGCVQLWLQMFFLSVYNVKSYMC